MKQQTITLLLTVFMSMYGVKVSAYDAKVENIYYTFSGTEATVVDMNYNKGHSNWNEMAYTGNVVIPETVTNNGVTYRVTAIGDNAFYYCTGLKSIFIPNSIISIGKNAFNMCTSLTSVNIPSSVTLISDGMFFSCGALTSIEIPEGVTSIGVNAFNGCSKLSNITIPSSVIYVGQSAFSGTAWYNNISSGVVYVGKILYAYKGKMPANTEIDIAEGTMCISGGVFKDCTGLTSISIPNSVTEIGPNTFSGCSNLRSITLPNKLKTIEERTFEKCKSLPAISFPNSVATIGEYAFDGCENIRTVELGSGMKSIGKFAFRDCSSIIRMDIPDNVETLGEASFMGCKGIERFVIGQGVTEIPNQIFSNTHIKSLTIGPNVKKVSKTAAATGATSGAKYSCPVKIICLPKDLPTDYSFLTGSTSIFLNTKQTAETTVGTSTYLSSLKYEFLNNKFEVDGVTYVPTNMSERTCDIIDCRYDDSNEMIIIEPTVTYRGVTFKVNHIQRYAFQENNHIKKVQVANEGLIYNKAFFGCENIEELKLDAKGNTGGKVFEGCKSLKTVELGEGLTSLGDEAFHDCVALQGIIIPNSVTSIGKYAFYGCSSLAYAKIGTGVKTISDYAFWHCESLTDIQIGSKVNSINYYAFMGCTSLPSIRIPKSVTTVDDAFTNCSSLREVILEDGDEAISMASATFSTCPLDSAYVGREFGNNSPFKKCESLRAAELSSRVTELGYEAFFNCKGLKNVHTSRSLTAIGDRSFCGCTGLERFEVGPNVEIIGPEAFATCTNITVLISYATTPPTCQYSALSDIDKWACTLFIPSGTISAYSEADQWKDFFFKEEMGQTEPQEGDTNGDGAVDTADVVDLVNLIMGRQSGISDEKDADVNGDGVVNIADVLAIVNIIIGK